MMRLCSRAEFLIEGTDQVVQASSSLIGGAGFGQPGGEHERDLGCFVISAAPDSAVVSERGDQFSDRRSCRPGSHSVVNDSRQVSKTRWRRPVEGRITSSAGRHCPILQFLSNCNSSPTSMTGVGTETEPATVQCWAGLRCGGHPPLPCRCRGGRLVHGLGRRVPRLQRYRQDVLHGFGGVGKRARELGVRGQTPAAVTLSQVQDRRPRKMRRGA